MYTPLTLTVLALAFSAIVRSNLPVITLVPSILLILRTTGVFNGRFAAIPATSISPVEGFAVGVPKIPVICTFSPLTVLVTSSPNWFIILYSIVPPAEELSPFNTRYLLGTSILVSFAVSPLKVEVCPLNSTV